MGCFWGAEELYWVVPGVVTTSVGYMGGYTPNPTYEEVCTGLTGHTEAVLVVYEPSTLSTLDVLRIFWEHHDPTQGFRQGNDVGTQYRSAIFTTTAPQRELAERTRDDYDAALRARGFDPITTEILDAADFEYYPAEAYHQQYLAKNPNGYRCHARTDVSLPTSS
jgi:peptide-methionine (S)-S-oxide reductase